MKYLQLVSSWSDGKTLPESYVIPIGERPGENVVPTCTDIPIIDLSKTIGNGHDRTKVIKEIIEASQEYGLFQVINHGVKKKSIDDARANFKEFFDQNKKKEITSVDLNDKCVVYSSNPHSDKENIHYWKDSFRLLCTPLEECIQSWPEKPTEFRETVSDYTVQVKELGSRILEMIAEGLGLAQNYFAKGLSQEHILNVHHYPPCPDPSLTIGARKHKDPQLLTILHQDEPGLEIFRDGQWLGIEPIPDAFLVNMGQQMQIVSNGKLFGVEHRVVTNKHKSRITAALFIEPKKNCFIEPAKELIDANNPPNYSSFIYEDYVTAFREAYAAKIDNVLENFKS